MNKKPILSIASQVRSKFEKKYGYSLEGYCSLASAELFTQLKKHGYSPVLHLRNTEYTGRVFIEVDDHVLDITATQFDGNWSSYSPVMFIDIQEKEEYHFWQDSRQYNTLEDLKSELKNTDWPEDQIPL